MTTDDPKKIVVLISGRGSNLLAIVRAMEKEKWRARVVAVISSTPDANGLAIAAAAGISSETINVAHFPDRVSYDAALREAIDCYAPDLLLLAGFMRILTDEFVNHYAGRMINIHPSLLPAFTGTRTHQRALDAGVRVHGATVHFVTPQLDAGPVIAQAVVPVLPDDTEEMLAHRVLEQEHILYPRVVRWFVEDKVKMENGRAVLSTTINCPADFLLGVAS
ncbi:MAG: phosphoribosylglycinamide formyltransferase [Burkholderiaceae bacterium]|jgi:phosphoribosylglycinamide formyltransferase-1|nr:phosphoribosylglycinamide formyltransferase [Burkholderiaceae bacterium]